MAIGEIHEKPILEVIPMGEIPSGFLKVIAAHLQAYINLPVSVHSPFEVPSRAYDCTRKQYDAVEILKELTRRPIDLPPKILAVVSVDIFIPILTYVFGEAQQGSRCAIISLYRLKAAPEGGVVSKEKAMERAAKVAIHEVGHLFNLYHCQQAKCVMKFSKGLDELDQNPLYLCQYCHIEMEDALKRLLVGIMKGDQAKEANAPNSIKPSLLA